MHGRLEMVLEIAPCQKPIQKRYVSFWSTPFSRFFLNTLETRNFLGVFQLNHFLKTSFFVILFVAIFR